jgi:hypothetical protein
VRLGSSSVFLDEGASEEDALMCSRVDAREKAMCARAGEGERVRPESARTRAPDQWEHEHDE